MSYITTERTFEVLVRRVGKPSLLYPSLNGDKSFALMKKMKDRGFETVAKTQANGITETLTLDDMDQIYGE